MGSRKLSESENKKKRKWKREVKKREDRRGAQSLARMQMGAARMRWQTEPTSKRGQYNIYFNEKRKDVIYWSNNPQNISLDKLSI